MKRFATHFLPALLIGALPLTSAAQDAAADKVLVTVNGEEIKQSDIDRRITGRYGARMAQVPEAQRAAMMAQLQSRTQDELVTRALLLKEVTAAKVVVPEADIAKAIEQVKGSLGPGVTFDQHLKTTGLDEAGFKKDVGEELSIQQFLETKTASVAAASDAEIKKFYDENPDQFQEKPSVKARHILLKTEGADETATAAKKAELEKIRAELVAKKGENFAELAKKHSGCPSSAKGGDLGQFGPGQMVPEFDKAAFSQKPGDIGPVIKTSFGYHIVQVQEKTEGSKTPLEKVKPNLGEYLSREKKMKIVRELIDGLRGKAKIVPAAAG